MADLTTAQITTVVADSLSTIADLPANNLPATPLIGLNDQQKTMFLSALKEKINALPYYMDDGTTSDQAYYDVALTINIVEEWPTVGDCIEWIFLNQIVVIK